MGKIKNMSAKVKNGTTPAHAHDTWLPHDGAAGEGPIGRRVTCGTKAFRALAPPPDHPGEGWAADWHIEPELSGPKHVGGTGKGYFTFAPTTLSHCFVMTCFAWFC